MMKIIMIVIAGMHLHSIQPSELERLVNASKSTQEERDWRAFEGRNALRKLATQYMRYQEIELCKNQIDLLTLFVQQNNNKTEEVAFALQVQQGVYQRLQILYDPQLNEDVADFFM